MEKKEKKKNLARQALETRRAKSRQRGEREEESPDEDDGDNGDDDSDDSEGMASCLNRILEVRLRPASTSRGQESLRGRQAGLVRVNRGSHLRAALAPTPLQCLCKVGPSPARNLLPRLRRAIRSSL